MKRASASASGSGTPEPRSNLVNITDINEVYQRLGPWQQELIARRKVKKIGRYYAKVDMFQNRWFHKFISLCRQPAGRAVR
eukprot:907335-Pleurochrysis_carterae.AAC.2